MAGPVELSDQPRMLVWISDEGDRCIEFNPSWLTWSGRSLDDACHHGWACDLVADDRERVLHQHREHVGNRRPYATQFQLARSDGQSRTMVAGASPWFHQDGSFAGFAGGCLDVGDLAAGRRSAHRIEAFHGAMLDALDEGILVQGAAPSGGRPGIRWAPLVGTGRGAALLRLARHLDEHGLPRPAPGEPRPRTPRSTRRRRSPSDSERVAVARMQLRPVRSPNDRFGHSGADDLLSVLARRLADTVRERDAVGQADDRTLAVLLDGVDNLQDAGRVVDSIRDALCQPVRLAGEAYLPQLDIDLQVLPEDEAYAVFSRPA